jgi:hypothetical protein
MLFYTSTFEPIGDPVKGRGEKWGVFFHFVLAATTQSASGKMERHRGGSRGPRLVKKN